MAVAVVWQGNLCSCWWVFSCQNPHNLTSAGTCVRVELQSALVQRAKLQTHPAVVHAVLQHFKVLTDGKPAGRRWVTREQYIRYADVCDQTTEGGNLCRAELTPWCGGIGSITLTHRRVFGPGIVTWECGGVCGRARVD